TGRRRAGSGRRLGLASQLADALEDIFADPGDLGRRPGSDLRDGVCTLPVLFAAAGRSPQRTALRQALARVAGHAGPDEPLLRCIELVRRGGGAAASPALLGEWPRARPPRARGARAARGAAGGAPPGLLDPLDHVGGHANFCAANESSCAPPAAWGDA